MEPLSQRASYISLYNNATNNLWGVDWAPYQYLVSKVSENGKFPGNYIMQFGTTGVPVGNYSVYLSIAMPYFDSQQLNANINITGLTMQIMNIYGASNSSNNITLNSNNLPFVNDTQTSTIQLNVTDTNGVGLLDGIVTGIFDKH